MLYIAKIDAYLKNLVKEFGAINFREDIELTREKIYFKLNEEQNLIKVVESLYTFLTTPNELEKYVETMQSNSSDRYVYCYNILRFWIFLIQNYN